MEERIKRNKIGETERRVIKRRDRDWRERDTPWFCTVGSA